MTQHTHTTPSRFARLSRFVVLPLAVASLTMLACNDDDTPVGPQNCALSSVTLSKQSVTMSIGELANVSADLRCVDGTPATRTVTWTTSDANVATVSNAGAITAVALGTATVTATAETKSATVAVTVAPLGTAVGATGGIVPSTDGNVELVIPAGALASMTDVVIEPVSAAVFAGDPLYIPGTGYLLKPDGLQLQVRAQLRIRYDGGQIPAGAFAEQLRLRERDRTQNQWRETEQHQLLEQKVQGEINRFGVYALAIQPPVGKMVGPAGGTVATADGNAELVIPAGALTTPTDVVIEPVPAAMFADDPLYIPGTGYQVKPDPLQLQTRATLRIRYSPTVLPPGTTAQQLRLRERDRDQNQWRETEQHQLLEQKVQGEINRFGVFAIVVQPSTVATIGPSGGVITSADGVLQLTIPAGALDAPVEITIERFDDSFLAVSPRASAVKVPASRQQASDDTEEELYPGTAYDIKPTGQTLKVPGQLRINYDPSKMPSGFTPEQLRIRERDRLQNRWRNPTECQSGNNSVSTSITRLGLFAIVASQTPDPVPARVTVSPSQLTLDEGDVVQVSATVYDSDGNVLQVPVTWSSSNTAIATVDENGKVTAVAEGSVTISATAGGVKGSGSVNVSRKPASVTVKPATASISIGGTAQFTAEVRDEAGNLLTRTVTWQSSATTIATVNNGLVTGVAAGTATITAKVQQVSGTATVTVNPPVTSITIGGNSNQPLEIGLTRQLTATVYDANGQPTTATVTWSTSDAAIASITNTGLVTGVAAGTVTITAAVGSASATTSIKVVGESEETGGNNMSWPVVFANGVGLTGSAVATDPGVRPFPAEGVTADTTPFWWEGNVADYNSIYYTQGSANIWRAQFIDGTGQAKYDAEAQFGDNLFAKNWTTTRPIRVEVALNATGVGTLKGFNMTLLEGEGTTELQGTNGSTADFVPLIWLPGATMIVERISGSNGSVLATVYSGEVTSEMNGAGRIIWGYQLNLETWTPPTGVTKDGMYRIRFIIPTDANATITGVYQGESYAVASVVNPREAKIEITVLP